MSVLSIHSKIGEVQSLLLAIENKLPQLPVESQNSVLTELEHFALQLTDCLQGNGRQPKTQENTLPELIEAANQTLESEAWLELVMRQARLGVWRWDSIDRTVKWIADLPDLLGVSPVEEISDPQLFFEMIHPDDRTIVINQMEERLKTGGEFYLEFRVIRADGKQTWFSSAGMVELDQAGRPLQISGINQDITHHKQIELALQESRESERAKVAELQALMDAVPAMIWISRDPQCKQMIGNKYGYEFLDMWEGANISKTAPDTDLSQQPYRNFKNGQEISSSDLPMQVAASTGVGTINYEFDLVFKNGVTRNVLGNVVPLFDPNGKPAGAVAVFVDITERKRIEEELQQSEHRFRVALSSVPIVVFTMDRDLRYTWIYNPRHNLTEEQIVGKRDDELNLPENVTELMELKRSVIETGQTVQQEIKIRINGAWFYYIVVFDPVLDPRGQVAGLIGAAFDTTTLRQLEAVQQKSEVKMATQRHLLQARENERVKIARDIHDGPLQSMIATVLNIEFLKEETSDQAIKAEIEPLVSSLKNAIYELRQVISEIRPPAGTEFVLPSAIRDYAENLCAKRPEIDFVVEMSEDVHHLSEELNITLYRICQEALQNIVRHSKATRMGIRLLLDNDQVILTIKDNGVGFSVPTDFTGLVADKHYGLTGITERAEAIGGTLQIFSEPGAGTEIKACIPADRS